MSITQCPGHMRSLKLNFSATVLTLGLKAKILENLRLCQAKFWGELRTRATFDRCVFADRPNRKLRFFSIRCNLFCEFSVISRLLNCFIYSIWLQVPFRVISFLRWFVLSWK